MKPLIIAIVFFASLALAGDVLVHQIQDNREVKLVGAYRDRTVAGFLHASFTEKGSTNRLEVVFPAHSHPTHVYTIMKIIEGSVDLRSPTPQNATMDVIFSVPTNHSDFSRWFLVTLKPQGSK